MPLLVGDRDRNSDDAPGSVLAVHLDRSDIALIIDALLQAEMTLPLIDPRYRHMKAIDHLRARQLSLADQLEEMIASEETAEPAAPWR